MSRTRNVLGLLSSWIMRGIWAVLDQALFALSNFIVNILLARWLSQEDFGAFSVSLTFFLIACAIHEAFLIEPMLIFGTADYSGNFRRYIWMLLKGHVLLTAAISGSFVAAALYFHAAGQDILAEAFLGLAISTPLVQFFWLMRRALYVLSAPELAAAAGFIYMAVLLSGTYLLFRAGWLSIITAQGLTGLSGAVAGAMLLRILWRRSGRRAGRAGADGSAAARSGEIRVPEIWSRHFGFGKWAVGTQLIAWVPGNFPYLLVSAWVGLDAAGTLRVLLLLMMPIWQTIEALSIVVLPALVRSRDGSRFLALMTSALLILPVLAAGYGLVLWLFKSDLLHLLYGGKYTADSEWLWTLSVIVIFTTINSVLLAGLRALGRPDSGFYGVIAAAVVVAGVAVLSVPAIRVNGALLAMLLGNMASSMVMGWKFASALRLRNGALARGLPANGSA